jgi:hypothetical protein
MNWVERRDRQDSGMPEFWNLFYIDIEETAKSFRQSSHARAEKLMSIVKRKNGCAHVILANSDSSKPERSIDICLDEERRRIFSRIEGEETASLSFGLDGDKVCLLDMEGKPMTNDQASEFFLKSFFFGSH